MKKTVPPFAATRPRWLVSPLAQAALPVLLAAACTGLHAQSSVNISGAIDAGVGYIKSDSKHVWKLTSGTIAASSLTFQGREDLGGGYDAIFLLRSLFVSGTGALSGTKYWGSEAKVGLGTPYGPQLLSA